MLKSATAAGYAFVLAFCEGLYGYSYPVLGDMGPAEPQTLLQVVDILDLHGTPASPALPQTKNFVI